MKNADNKSINEATQKRYDRWITNKLSDFSLMEKQFDDNLKEQIGKIKKYEDSVGQLKLDQEYTKDQIHTIGVRYYTEVEQKVDTNSQGGMSDILT